MIYLYAIAYQFNESLDPPMGIENQGVYQINCGPFAPIVSPTLTTTYKITLSKEAIYQHEKVIEFYMKHTPLLPVCFNTLFDNENELMNILKYYSLEIEANLIKVSNCVEMGVKVLVKTDNRPQTIDNRPQTTDLSLYKKYILEKFSIYKDAFYLQEKYKDKSDTIYNLLEELSKQGHKFPITAASQLILNSAFLVNKESLSDFKSKFQTIKQDFKDFAFLLSGPWPPYSFVDFSIERKVKGVKESCLS